MNSISIYRGEQLCPKINKWVLRVIVLTLAVLRKNSWHDSFPLWQWQPQCFQREWIPCWGLLCRLHLWLCHSPGELWCLDGAGVGTILTESSKYSPKGGRGVQGSGWEGSAGLMTGLDLKGLFQLTWLCNLPVSAQEPLDPIPHQALRHPLSMGHCSPQRIAQGRPQVKAPILLWCHLWTPLLPHGWISHCQSHNLDFEPWLGSKPGQQPHSRSSGVEQTLPTVFPLFWQSLSSVHLSLYV